MRKSQGYRLNWKVAKHRRRWQITSIVLPRNLHRCIDELIRSKSWLRQDLTPTLSQTSQTFFSLSFYGDEFLYLWVWSLCCSAETKPREHWSRQKKYRWENHSYSCGGKTHNRKAFAFFYCLDSRASVVERGLRNSTLTNVMPHWDLSFNEINFWFTSADDFSLYF